MNIIISGLTAAGKTTHALLLARRLGYDYVSASQLMLRRLGIEPDESNTLWATRMAEVETRRDDSAVDQELNKYLATDLRQRDHVVFDSWSGAWLYQGPHCLRVWIESDRRSRAMKARVSQYPHGPILPLATCQALVDEKDDTTAARLRPLLGSDVRYNRAPFDLVLDNSTLINEPTIESARRGIASFHDQLVQIVSDRLLTRS
jgi:cytidylate kinase